MKEIDLDVSCPVWVIDPKDGPRKCGQKIIAAVFKDGSDNIDQVSIDCDYGHSLDTINEHFIFTSYPPKVVRDAWNVLQAHFKEV